MTTLAPGLAFDDAGFARFLETRRETPAALAARRAAWETFGRLDWPTRRDEEWIRTDLRTFHLDRFQLTGGEIGPSEVESFVGGSVLTGSIELGGQIVSIDGTTVAERIDERLAAKGVLFQPLERAVVEHPELIERYLMTTAYRTDADRFAALHAAFWTGGALLYVPRGVTIEHPLHLLAGIRGGADLSHVLVVLEPGAEATLLTEYLSPDDEANGLHCGGIELHVGAGANLRFVNLQDWGRNVRHFAHQKALVDRDASLQWTIGALGARLAKVNQHVELVGRGATCQVNGVMFTEGRQHLAYHTLQHHVAPDCRSDFLYKAALQDQSRTVWQGMIKVDPRAQRTDGYQRNDNLILSSAARADSIPGLEIEADDVRCTHGSTSGRVDEELIFYACSRGFTRREAVRMIVTGFFQQVFDRITLESVRDALSESIAHRVRDLS
ncbi:MAG TPA: Fe-S cluster assembly protein SufD [Pirellulaceae bacterium]|nr:Fe-S cluster assembly protein SufD [Pirellulaceae bacterium]